MGKDNKSEFQPSDYSLVGKDTALAIEKVWPMQSGTPHPYPRKRCAICSSAMMGLPSGIPCSGLACFFCLGVVDICCGAVGGLSFRLPCTAICRHHLLTPAGTNPAMAQPSKQTG